MGSGGFCRWRRRRRRGARRRGRYGWCSSSVERRVYSATRRCASGVTAPRWARVRVFPLDRGRVARVVGVFGGLVMDASLGRRVDGDGGRKRGAAAEPGSAAASAGSRVIPEGRGAGRRGSCRACRWRVSRGGVGARSTRPRSAPPTRRSPGPAGWGSSGRSSVTRDRAGRFPCGLAQRGRWARLCRADVAGQAGLWAALRVARIVGCWAGGSVSDGAGAGVLVEARPAVGRGAAEGLVVHASRSGNGRGGPGRPVRVPSRDLWGRDGERAGHGEARGDGNEAGYVHWGSSFGWPPGRRQERRTVGAAVRAGPDRRVQVDERSISV